MNIGLLIALGLTCLLLTTSQHDVTNNLRNELNNVTVNPDIFINPDIKIIIICIILLICILTVLTKIIR